MSVLKIVALCISCLSLGLALANIVWVIVNNRKD